MYTRIDILFLISLYIFLDTTCEELGSRIADIGVGDREQR